MLSQQWGPSGTKLDRILNALDSKFSEECSIAPDQSAELTFQCCNFILRNQVPLTNLTHEIESKYKELGNLRAQIDHYTVLRTESEANLENQLVAANVTKLQLDSSLTSRHSSRHMALN